MLLLSASLEHASEHPIGAAIAAGAVAEVTSLATVAGFESARSRSASGKVDGHDVLVGRRRFLADHDVDLDGRDDTLDRAYDAAEAAGRRRCSSPGTANYGVSWSWPTP